MLSPSDKSELLRLLDSGRPLPEAWRAKLFPASGKTVEIGKEYRLEYEGKMKREQVLAETPAAPWQLVRRFNTERPHPDGWRNLLVWGYNLTALRDLIFLNADLFEAFVKMPDRAGYKLPISYKPSKTGRTHGKSENFHPDFFLRLANSHEILVVEVKQDGDDSNRNRAKLRDGEKHFATLNQRLTEEGEPWRYRFYFLAPENFSEFFKVVKAKRHIGWRSKLMQDLISADSEA
jgi:hypothetical protein